MSDCVNPSLESITLRGKYTVSETSFDAIKEKLTKALVNRSWFMLVQQGESVVLVDIGVANPALVGEKKTQELWMQYVRKIRSGVPIYYSFIVTEHIGNNLLAEVECRPAMWYKISTLGEEAFAKNKVQEALIECRSFVKQLMSLFPSKEVEPVSVYPIIQRTEIKSRLLNLGLKEAVEHLDKAERHIVQNNFEESLKSSRTAFEKMIDWEIEKRGLEKTNNYKNDLERLRSKGFIDSITTDLIQTYYRCLSNIAVHAKGEVPPGFHEAQMGYGITLIMLQYFADKLP